MGRWYTKYMPYFGDYTNVSQEVYDEIRNNLQRLEHNPVIDVSVVVIAYNEEKNILPCVYSLSNMQTDLCVEVIVVNNNSKDRTQEIIDKMGVRTVFQPRPGHGNARQAGLDIARGEWHFSADSDSLYPPTYINAMMKRLRRKGVSVVFSPYGFYADGRKSPMQLLVYEFFRDIVATLRTIKRPEMSAGGAAMAFRTEHGREIGWRCHILRGEDGAMMSELKRFGRPCFVLDRKARIASSSRRLDMDGSYGGMIWKRFSKEFRRIHKLFYKKEVYHDQESNLRKDS